MRGVLDLRGQTSLRELVLLLYRAVGVLCPVTLAMHLAAAVESPPSGPHPRPCVVVAGGREPPAWETYPTHDFLHTVGQLPCCAEGGCWKSRIVPLGDGDPKDAPEHLCDQVEHGLPECMRRITPELVIHRIEASLAHRPHDSLKRSQVERVQGVLSSREDFLGST
jgi:ADP-heptose:LPS heptosyltransferase